MRRVFGQIDTAELKAIDEGLVLFLSLGDRLSSAGQTAGISGIGLDLVKVLCARADGRFRRNSERTSNA